MFITLLFTNYIPNKFIKVLVSMNDDITNTPKLL